MEGKAMSFADDVDDAPGRPTVVEGGALTAYRGTAVGEVR